MVDHPLSLAPGNGELIVEIVLPEGYELNQFEPGTLRLSSDDEGIARPDTDAPQTANSPVHFPLTLRDGEASLRLNGALNVCAENGGPCFSHLVDLHLPLTVDSDAPDEATVQIEVSLPG